jgi:hypothetical protein
MSLIERDDASKKPASKTSIVFLLLGLFNRLLLFAFIQAVIALGYWISGNPNPWEQSTFWWPLTAALASLISLFLLDHLLLREGCSYRTLIFSERGKRKNDLLVTAGLFILAGPITLIPNMGIATLLFGSYEATAKLLFQPLPSWAVVLSVVAFPLLVALSELPTYFGYVMPRLEEATGRTWAAVLIPALLLAAQHCTLPLRFDFRFITWRLVMFLPFALMLAIVLRWRPRLLPYLMVGHWLIDLMTAWMVVSVSL